MGNPAWVFELNCDMVQFEYLTRLYVMRLYLHAGSNVNGNFLLSLT
jgi:hypothetical protein